MEHFIQRLMVERCKYCAFGQDTCDAWSWWDTLFSSDNVIYHADTYKLLSLFLRTTCAFAVGYTGL